MMSVRALCCVGVSWSLGALAESFHGELREGFLAGLETFDRNSDGLLTRQEVSAGIVTEFESPDERLEPESYDFGRKLCEDPYPDSVSINECLIAEAREQLPGGFVFPTTPEMVLDWYGALCDVPSWHSGECLEKCSVCRGVTEEEQDASAQRALLNRRNSRMNRRRRPSEQSGGMKILISGDWHIEPWYKYDKKCKAVCRYKDSTIKNMWKCEVDGKHSTCKVNGRSDPPFEFGKSHFDSAAGQADLFFFMGDTEAHSFKDAKGGTAEGVGNLVDKVLGDVLRHFDASDVAWANGNNDGPHYKIFQKQDSLTIAYANSVLKAGIVTNDLGIKYSGDSQTTLFKKLGFYCKALPRMGSSAYVIVYNTILGNSNRMQQSALTTSLAWIKNKHGDSAQVYLIGHQPSIMNKGTHFVPSTYRKLIKGVFAGHVHKSASTTSDLFTQVGALTQAAGESDGEFFLAKGISSSSATVSLSNKHDMCLYKDSRGKTVSAGKWECQSGPSPAPTPAPTPSPAPTPPPAPTPTGADTLLVGDSLVADEKLVSQNGEAQLVMQADGNLVLYHGSNAVWSSKSQKHSGAHMTFETDGNLVVYDGSKPVWSSKSHKNAAMILLQDNCNLKMFDSNRNKLWDLGVSCSSALLV